MYRGNYFICLWLLPFAMHNEMQLGIDNYFAGRNDRAKEYFQQHLNESLTPEERNVTLYNLATTLMNEGDFSGANTLFQKIDQTKISSNEVKAAFLHNQKLCSLKLEQGKKEQQTIHPDQESKDELEKIDEIVQKQQQTLSQSPDQEKSSGDGDTQFLLPPTESIRLLQEMEQEEDIADKDHSSMTQTAVLRPW